MARKTKLERFNEHVLSKFEIYNSLFLTLPFKSILKTSLLLPLFSEHCKSNYSQKKSPLFIVESFFDKYCVELTDKERFNLMFSFIQFIERRFWQKVIFHRNFARVRTLSNIAALAIAHQITNCSMNQ